MKLSIVTTLYKSAPFVEEFYKRASAAAQKIGGDYEIVMVDDGSPDHSLLQACRIAQADPRVRVVELSRNFGHHKALMTGLAHAGGELVFLIDSDLEEAPELLNQFYERIQVDDCDVVYGFQERRKGNAWERVSGQIAWYLINRLSSVEIPMNQSTVRLMRRAYVDALLLHRENNVAILGLCALTGFHQAGFPISKGHRRNPSYTFLHRLVVLANAITSFSTVPLIGVTYLGLIISIISFILGLVVIAQKLIYNSAIGWASTMVSIWFVGGMIMFCLGILSAYISRIFDETKNRPYVIVRRIHQKDRG